MKWARSDRRRQRELDAVSCEPAPPRLVQGLSLGSPSGVVVWSPRGKGRLRFAHPAPPRFHPPTRRGGLSYHDTYLTLDNVPLLLWRRNDCPSCEQLVRAAVDRPEPVRRFRAGARALTRSMLAKDLGACVPALEWLFTLLPAGLYLLSLEDYAPMTEDGRCIFGAFHQAERCDALSDRPSPPRCLIPTQRASAFREDAWTRARSAFRTHPGIALYLRGTASALLDGHHRALAAALHGETFACITVVPAEVSFPLPRPGEACAVVREPEVRFARVGATLSVQDLPEHLGPWLHARARCTDRRWVFRRATIERFDTMLSKRSRAPSGFPPVDVEDAASS